MSLGDVSGLSGTNVSISLDSTLVSDTAATDWYYEPIPAEMFRVALPTTGSHRHALRVAVNDVVAVFNESDPAQHPAFDYDAGYTATVAAASPPAGVAGTVVTITGSNFLANATDILITAAGVSFSVTKTSSTQILATYV